MQLVFEMMYNPLGLVHTVVKPAIFVILHLQDPSLQCSPLRQNRNASVATVPRNPGLLVKASVKASHDFVASSVCF